MDVSKISSYSERNSLNYSNDQIVYFGRDITNIEIDTLSINANDVLKQTSKKRDQKDELLHSVVKKHKSDSIDETISVEEAGTEEVNVLTNNEFTEKLKSSTLGTSQERFEKLLSLCTFDKENSNWNLWFEGTFSSQTTWMHIMIDEREYDSQCFVESEQNYPEKSAINQSYYFINACYEDNKDKYYFQIRLDKEIGIAEIIHIERGLHVSGNEVKSICMEIIDFLKIKKVFLKDDSKISNQIKGIAIALRIVLPIVSEMPKTWYSGFKPMNFTETFIIEAEEHLPQNELHYTESVNFVRGQLIHPLTSVQDSGQLEKWIKKYLSKEADTKECTVHQIAKAIYRAARGQDSRFNKSRLKTIANNDFLSFYSSYLSFDKINEQNEEYKNVLKVMHDYKIWVREI